MRSLYVSGCPALVGTMQTGTQHGYYDYVGSGVYSLFWRALRRRSRILLHCRRRLLRHALVVALLGSGRQYHWSIGDAGADNTVIFIVSMAQLCNAGLGRAMQSEVWPGNARPRRVTLCNARHSRARQSKDAPAPAGANLKKKAKRWRK